jgi:hypothetical protein
VRRPKRVTECFGQLLTARSQIGDNYGYGNLKFPSALGEVTAGLSFLPGDIKYESPNGNVRVYFPTVTSIVLSVVLTLILRLFS